MTMISPSPRNPRAFAMNIGHRRVQGLQVLQVLCLLLGLLVLSGCEAAEQPTSGPPVVAAEDAGAASAKPEESRMWMTIGGRRFAITLADNEAARAFAAQLPLTLDMSDLNGNEKHTDLPDALPTKPGRPGTIRNGDLMLYGTNTLVVFYETFSSSYSYTRLGHVDDPGELTRVLGPGGVRIGFSSDK